MPIGFLLMEIDECVNYEMAMGALTEAYKALSRSCPSSSESDALKQRLEQRLYNIKSNKNNTAFNFLHQIFSIRQQVVFELK